MKDLARRPKGVRDRLHVPILAHLTLNPYPTMLSTFILRLLPRSVLFRYTDYIRGRLIWLETQVDKAEGLLEDVSPEFEYTEGFRLHLERKLGEWNAERFAVVQKISLVEDILFPPTSS